MYIVEIFWDMVVAGSSVTVSKIKLSGYAVQARKGEEV
jgi:hypothetical protein